ncbi:hypothetical protein E1A91_A02G159700v1 [Gossypium mustelinum]|uniref:Inositol-tetrakisphosphate 1-kinase n=1 Tax=Gossypium mustelinum TaxID=34275 RepID=A0A5D3AB10_GOSMU|nr:hypothetical protein E1A91_A02G159700v1 [Gossypium mustelinum]TYJ47024.1 hypothetical protein E1A91_A02G159700v1 [Gossypium mustelinum]TYJ47029.1 hypothetical protein E1A91_A02G159700v1 [Gossypium mustelinum]TYJ47032.1 hypothetical protein E1A91_A02G159700v1 [Gossypium mustelinum]
MSNLSSKPYQIGYALTPKKEQTFIVPSLLSCAGQNGVVLTKIDPTKPLIQQGPFDCILHKLYDSDWKQNLQDFASRNPNIPIIDSPESIDILRNRISMLETVSKLKINNTGVPKQITITEEFVNHGGVVFKVYVAGKYFRCVKRKSLPDISEEKLVNLKGSLPFSQVSNLAAAGGGEGCKFEKTEMPPESLVKELVEGLKEELRLNLFNFDVIRDGKNKENYLVIDINYFPGYAKMPDFESVITDFLRDVMHKDINCGDN